jgi:carboxyl-terminal processing protease
MAGRSRSGLTLVELLVAIAFLGVTGALLMPRLVGDSSQPAAIAEPEGGYIGIGALLGHHMSDDGYVTIHQPFPGAPAEAVGLQPGDLILRVDGVDMQNEDVDTVRERIMAGPIDSQVRLTLRRDNQPFDLPVTRQRIYPPEPFSWFGGCPVTVHQQ